MSASYSPKELAIFIDGYLKAIRRVQSAEHTLVGGFAQQLGESDDPESLLSGQSQGREKIENWAFELEKAVEETLGLGRDDVLAWDLVEYILWFEAFFPGTNLYKLEFRPLEDGVLRNSTYEIELPDAPPVFVQFNVTGRGSPKTKD